MISRDFRADGFRALAELFEISARDFDQQAEECAALAATFVQQGEIRRAEEALNDYRANVVFALLEQANAAACRMYLE
jgi:hypothetical protein